MNNRSNFVMRKRHGSVENAILLTVIGLTVAYVGTHVPSMAGHNYLFFVGFCIPVFYMLYSLRRTIKVITRMEFKNALFASAMSDSNNFNVIIDDKGAVLHYDNELIKFFPNILQENFIASLSAVAGFSIAQEDAFMFALRHGKGESFTFPIVNDKGENAFVRLTLKPLRRPANHFLLQGRIYTPERKEDAVVVNNAGVVQTNEAAPNFVCKLLSQSPMGVYVVSPNGCIRFVNDGLEAALGYDAGEIVQKQLTLVDLRYGGDFKYSREDDLCFFDDRGNVSGKVSLRRKNQSLLYAKVRQEVARNEDGTIQMIIGIVDVLDA